MNAKHVAEDAKVCCMVCRKATAVAVVKDFAHHTFYACAGCVKIMERSHPAAPVVIRLV